MSNKAFQQNLDDKKGPQPGGPYLIQMLFKEPVEMPDKEKMTAIMEKHIGSTECFCYDKKMAGFAALDHVAEFQDGKCPVQLMVMKCDRFKGKGFDAFLMSQMWDCQRVDDFRENAVVSTQSARQCKDAVDLVCQKADVHAHLIRRLTPLECERLQGFPDGWTDIPGASDSARYKALGNSVAIPCVDFVMHCLVQAVQMSENIR